MQEKERLLFMDALIKFYNKGYKYLMFTTLTLDLKCLPDILKYIKTDTLETEVIIMEGDFFRFWYSPSYSFIGQFKKSI